MGEPRLSKILIGALLIGLFSFSFMLFLNEGASDYSVTGYTNSTLEKFDNNAKEIREIGNNSRTNLDSAGAGSSSSEDIFGSFFSSSWTALKSTWGSITTLTSLGATAVEEIPAVDDAYRKYLTITISTIIVLILVIAIFFHFIKASNRL